MPAGKALIVGGSFLLPELPDCTCAWLLLRDRKPNHPKLDPLDESQVFEQILRALRIYIGRTNATAIPTATDINKKVQKIILAAQRLLSAQQSKQAKRIIHWEKKLSEQIGKMEEHSYQFLTQKFIDQCNGTVSSQTIQDFVESISETRTADYKITIQTIAAIKLKLPTIKGFPDPHLPDLILQFADVWLKMTGRNILPTSVAKASNEKKYLFAEWVQEVIRKANENLPGDQQVKLPKEGAIFDIAVLLAHAPKIEKSG